MTEKESILSKIKKLQNLTTERGATPEEAAAAAAKAQALLFQHNLAQGEVDTANPDSKPDPYGKVEHEHEGAQRNSINWRRSLLHAIAKYNFCSTVYSPNTTKQSVIGKKSNVETVLYLNQCISRQIDDLANEAAKTQLSNKAAYKISFCLGAVATITARLSEQRREDERKATGTQHEGYGVGQAGQQNALILRNCALELRSTVKKFFPHLRSGGGSRISHSEGYHAGKQAGHTVSMNRGIGQGRPSGRLH